MHDKLQSSFVFRRYTDYLTQDYPQVGSAAIAVPFNKKMIPWGIPVYQLIDENLFHARKQGVQKNIKRRKNKFQTYVLADGSSVNSPFFSVIDQIKNRMPIKQIVLQNLMAKNGRPTGRTMIHKTNWVISSTQHMEQ